MPIEISMPRLSDTMEEGTLIAWKVKVGDAVSAGDVLADVETDKATMELQTFEDGTVAKLAIGEGETTEIGKLICVLAGDGESVEDAVAAAGSGESGESGGGGDGGGEKKTEKAEKKEETPVAAPEPTVSTPVAAAAASGGGGGNSGKASPLARKLAEEHGLDIASIAGSGPEGRVIKRDVLAAAAGGGGDAGGAGGGGGAGTQSVPTLSPQAGSPKSAPAAPLAPATLEAKTVKLSNMRKTIAKRLVESKTTVPHFQVSVAVNMDPLMALRKTINTQLESQGVKLSVNDFVTKAVAISCVQHPVVNASFTGDAVAYHGSVNVGTAIALPIEPDGTGGGLVVAVVRDVERKGLRQIADEVKVLAKKARTSGLSVDEMSDSTITISNLGMPQYGVTQFTAIVNPPNAAIVAVGAAMQKPVVRDGEIVVGTEMNVTLSGDHRVIDGASAAEYLATVRQMLENPAVLLV